MSFLHDGPLHEQSHQPRKTITQQACLKGLFTSQSNRVDCSMSVLDCKTTFQANEDIAMLLLVLPFLPPFLGGCKEIGIQTGYPRSGEHSPQQGHLSFAKPSREGNKTTRACLRSSDLRRSSILQDYKLTAKSMLRSPGASVRLAFLQGTHVNCTRPTCIGIREGLRLQPNRILHMARIPCSFLSRRFSRCANTGM